MPYTGRESMDEAARGGAPDCCCRGDGTYAAGARCADAERGDTIETALAGNAATAVATAGIAAMATALPRVGVPATERTGAAAGSSLKL
jgi:hypothetical protein